MQANFEVDGRKAVLQGGSLCCSAHPLKQLNTLHRKEHYRDLSSAFILAFIAV
jgi:hypothetical protein